LGSRRKTTTQQATPASKGGQKRSAARVRASTSHSACAVAAHTGKSSIPASIFNHFGTRAELAFPPREARHFSFHVGTTPGIKAL
jgi:hypothetical protein